MPNIESKIQVANTTDTGATLKLVPKLDREPTLTQLNLDLNYRSKAYLYDSTGYREKRRPRLVNSSRDRVTPQMRFHSKPSKFFEEMEIKGGTAGSQGGRPQRTKSYPNEPKTITNFRRMSSDIQVINPPLESLLQVSNWTYNNLPTPRAAEGDQKAPGSVTKSLKSE